MLLLVLLDCMVFGILARKEEIKQPVNEAPVTVHTAPSASAQPEEVSFEPYYYSLLSEDEKKTYLIIYEGLSSFTSRIDLPLIDDLTFIKTSTAVKMDHPEIWWGGAPVYYMRGNRVLYAEYDIPEDAASTAQRVDALADEVIAGMPEGAGQYGKALYLFMWLCQNVTYDDSAIQASQDVRSVFLDHASVCGGIASAYALLAQKAGLNCITVCGSALSEGTSVNHAWNEVCIDGTWVWADATWGNQNGWVNMLEFGMNDEEALRSRTISTTAGADPLPEGSFSYPSASGNAYSYCARNGCLFESYDRDTVSDYFLGVPVSSYMYIQFENSDAYLQARNDLYGEANSSAAFFHTVVFQKFGEYRPWYFTDMPEKNAMIFTVK